MAPWPQLCGRHAVSNPDPGSAQQTRDIIDEELEKETLSLVGWRKVPVDTNVLGTIAKASLPSIEQVFVNAPPGWVDKDSRAPPLYRASPHRKARQR